MLFNVVKQEEWQVNAVILIIQKVVGKLRDYPQIGMNKSE